MDGDSGVYANCVTPKDLRFLAFPSSAMTLAGDVSELATLPFSRTTLAPAGRVRLPRSCVLNPPSVRLGFPGGWGYPEDGTLSWNSPPHSIFPQQTDYPEMAVARLEDAYCLPYAPPFLPASRRVASDFNIPWNANAVGWFRHEGGNSYRLPIEMDLSSARRIDTGFFMSHLVSGHFGHFIGDCLSRMHAWRLCREIFGDVKLIIDHTREDTRFRQSLLDAAGASSEDVIFSQGLFHCRKLLVATPSLGVSRYASPISANLWRQIRDALPDTRPAHADKIYLSRSGQSARKMTNEAEVEDVFRRFGFVVVNPERLSVEEQIGMIAAARYVAGPGGSAMFNLAFQKRLESVLILTSETFMQTSELLFLAGAECSVYFHVGLRDMPGDSLPTVNDSWRADLARLPAHIGDWLSGHS